MIIQAKIMQTKRTQKKTEGEEDASREDGNDTKLLR
jgi:hypothetical protein